MIWVFSLHTINHMYTGVFNQWYITSDTTSVEPTDNPLPKFLISFQKNRQHVIEGRYRNAQHFGFSSMHNPIKRTCIEQSLKARYTFERSSTLDFLHLQHGILITLSNRKRFRDAIPNLLINVQYLHCMLCVKWFRKVYFNGAFVGFLATWLSGHPSRSPLASALRLEFGCC